MHFSVLKIQFQAFFENSKRYNEKGRKYNAYGKGVGFSFFFQIMPRFIKNSSVIARIWCRVN